MTTVRRVAIRVVSVMTLAIVTALTVGALAQAPAPDAAMTRVERVELIDLLHKTEKEFMDAVESVSDAQWTFKAGADRWSIGEVAEHLVLAEAGLFTTATGSVAAGDGSAAEGPHLAESLLRCNQRVSTAAVHPAAQPAARSADCGSEDGAGLSSMIAGR